MAVFFRVCTVGCSLSLITVVALGHFAIPLGLSPRFHILFGLGSSIFSALLHCLVFAIFTGSGKDARLLVEGLKLDPRHVLTVKKFRRQIFPPALKAIGLLMVLAVLGGAVGARKLPGVLSWAHPILAWVAVIYNLRVFWLESAAVTENSVFIHQINAEAAKVSGVPGSDVYVSELTDSEFVIHARALGRFLCFLSYNVWLPYFYFRFVMSVLWVSWVPFLIVSGFLYVFGRTLQWRFSA